MMPRSVVNEFPNLLRDKAIEYITKLEEIFGKCDQNFQLGCVLRADKEKHSHGDGPYIWFRSNCLDEGSIIDICISTRAWDEQYLNQATWQIAHECVHLLDPVEFGNATILEEGLATWFQNNEKYHRAYVKNYIAINERVMEEKLNENTMTCSERKYFEAGKIVNHYMPQLERAVKRLRAQSVKISEIQPCHLQPYLRKDISIEELEELCSPFIK